MASKEKEYIKLPGRGFKRGTIISLVGIRARLWQGKDHILSVLNFGYFEEYKRFYYKDIQAFTIKRTSTAITWNLVFIFLTFFFSAIALTRSPEIAPLVWPLPAIFVLCIIINTARGKSCMTCIHTAVGYEELPSLSRLRKAEKVISMLEPLIEGAQNELSALKMEQPATQISSKKVQPPQVNRGSSEKLSNYGGKYHKALFVILLIDALQGIIMYFQNNMIMTILSTILFFGITALVILSLIKQHNSHLGKSVRVITWICMVYMAIMYFASYVYNMIYIAMENPEVINNQWKQIEFLSTRSPSNDPYFMAMLITGIVSSSLLGISGFVFFRSSVVEKADPPEPPPLQFEDAG